VLYEKKQLDEDSGAVDIILNLPFLNSTVNRCLCLLGQSVEYRWFRMRYEWGRQGLGQQVLLRQRRRWQLWRLLRDPIGPLHHYHPWWAVENQREFHSVVTCWELFRRTEKNVLHWTLESVHQRVVLIFSRKWRSLVPRRADERPWPANTFRLTHPAECRRSKHLHSRHPGAGDPCSGHSCASHSCSDGTWVHGLV